MISDPTWPSKPEEPEDWMSQGLCKDADPDIFFGGELNEDGSGSNNAFTNDAAKAICAPCGVRDECLTYAVEHGIRYGVWGGMTEKERKRVRRRRTR